MSVAFRRDALLAGLFYLGLAIFGALGFMMIRAELFVQGDPARTLSNLVEREGLARAGIAFELALVIFQALAAVWFGKLFRETDAFGARVLTLFGMVNAIAVLISAALMQSALDAALGSMGVEPTLSHLLYSVSGQFWQAGMIFFGLWLIPMGWLVWKSGIAHRALGWILILGGVGYVLNLFAIVLVPDAGAWVIALPLLATVGEFWMIGLLLWIGVRRRT
jgi:hypothetical protein